MAERVPTLLADARLAARHIAIKHQLLHRTHWGLLESRTNGEPDVIFNKSSSTWLVCRDTAGLVRASNDVPESFQTIVTISKQGDQGTETFKITPANDLYGIKVNDEFLKPEEYTLPRDSTVYIGKTEYIFRSLTDVDEPPSHASRYQIRHGLAKAGGQGVVQFGKTVGNQREYAVAIKRMDVQYRQLQNIALELSIWESLDHPAILRLHDWWIETDDSKPDVVEVYTVSALAAFGTLEDCIQNEGPLSPALARLVLTQIIDGLLYMHSQGIMHCDLKPSNVLVFHKDADSIAVKICDFGLVKQRKRDPFLDVEPAGSAGWAPPDILNHVYNEKSESFGVGAIMFFLLFAMRPFLLLREKKRSPLPTRISTRVPQIDQVTPEMMKDIGDAGQDLLKRLMEPQNCKRISLEDASDHPFLVPTRPFELLAFNNPLVQNFLSNKDGKGNYSAAGTPIPEFIGVNDLGPPATTEPPETPRRQPGVLGNLVRSPRELASTVSEVGSTGVNEIRGDVELDGNLVVHGNVVVTGKVVVIGAVEVLGEAKVRGPFTVHGQLMGLHPLDHDCENYRSETNAEDEASNSDSHDESIDPDELPEPSQTPVPFAPERRAATQGYRSGLSLMASVWPGTEVPDADYGFPEVDDDARSDDTVMAGAPGEASANPIPRSSTSGADLLAMDNVAEVEMRLSAAVGDDASSPDLAGPSQGTEREGGAAVDAYARNEIAESSNHAIRPRRSARRTAGQGRGDEAGTTSARVDQGEQQDSDDESNGLNNKRRKTRSSTRNKKLKTTKN
ncbi:kinase-like protein [Punctularia strigosozonata HHB-11173 SS5]|uniref:Kinase-like protein n=1 Tax=Punctularia strigosozonata (strain HHB-11173) TaxID=741275 RepID=R7S1U0_PUNST|nr:kinase-like protein [Punctularia strigosozonata HHB-11173 SS5]EIN04188.1 kinase-like protein [Punctularia strigosozonata HHB-11173 SS5]